MTSTDLRARFASLTPRERQVFPLVVSGRLNKQIAVEIGASEATIKVHRSQVMRKMGERCQRTEFVVVNS
jgi:FixJ family two-component response regulator